MRLFPMDNMGMKTRELYFESARRKQDLDESKKAGRPLRNVFLDGRVVRIPNGDPQQRYRSPLDTGSVILH